MGWKWHTPLDQRLLQRREVDAETGCWEWTGTRLRFGYGQIYVSGKMKLAHRMAWETWKGPIPVGIQVLHACDNAPCFNPDHLFLGTPADNVEDMDAKGRGNRPGLGQRPPERAPRGERNRHAKLTERDVLVIRADETRTRSQLARAFGVSPQTIWQIRQRQTWRHI